MSQFFFCTKKVWVQNSFLPFVSTFNVVFLFCRSTTFYFLNSFSFSTTFCCRLQFVSSIISKITKASIIILCLFLSNFREKNISLYVPDLDIVVTFFGLSGFFFKMKLLYTKLLFYFIIGDCNPFFLQTVDVMPLIFFSSLPNKLLD